MRYLTVSVDMVVVPDMKWVYHPDIQHWLFEQVGYKYAPENTGRRHSNPKRNAIRRARKAAKGNSWVGAYGR